MSAEKKETKKEQKPESEAKSMKSIKAKGPVRNKRRMDKNTRAGVKDVLTIDPSVLDKENYEYRIVNMEPGRVERMEKKDWDVAHIDADVVVGDPKAGVSQPKGSTVEFHVGGGTKAVLMCKRKDWCDDDRADKESILMDKQKMMQSDYKEKHKPIE